MTDTVPESNPVLPSMFSWRRVRYPIAVSLVFGLLLSPGWKASHTVLFGRLMFIAAMGVLVFGFFERRPKRLPRWLARWVLQVLGVAIVMPIAAWIAYRLTTLGDPLPFWRDKDRLEGFATMAVLGLLLAPWMAVSALLGQISGAAQKQALAFELERSRLERKAIDARLRLLQAQVEPHFLFNTLANVRELVDSGSSQASEILGSLIAYLRAAVPRLQNRQARSARNWNWSAPISRSCTCASRTACTIRCRSTTQRWRWIVRPWPC